MPVTYYPTSGGAGSPLSNNKIWKGNDQGIAEEASIPAGTGDVIAPASNTNNYIPQWDGADSKTLKNGIPTSTFATADHDHDDDYAPAGDASTSAKGIVELATVGETDTGSDDTRAVTPDGLAGSIHGTRLIHIQVFDYSTALATGDGKVYLLVNGIFNGMNIVGVSATLGAAKSTSGTPTIQIARGRQANATTIHSFTDVLSTRITIDENEWFSGNAATAAVIDTNADDLATGDILRIDVDVAGTGSQGLYVTISCRLP